MCTAEQDDWRVERYWREEAEARGAMARVVANFMVKVASVRCPRTVNK